VSTIKSDDSNITINASGSGRDIKFQANGVEKASIDSSGNLTVTGNIAHASNLTLDAGGDLYLDSDGGNWRFNDGGTDIGLLKNSSSDFQIESKVQDKDIKFVGNDGGSSVTALTLDMSDAGYATFNNWIKVNDRVVGNSNLVLNTSDGNEKIHLDGTGYIKFEANGSERMRITSDGRGLSQFTAQSWVRVNMNGGHSTVDSHNISSISDGGTGVCTVNIATDPANANYGVVAAPHDTSNGSESVSSIGTGTFTVKVSLVISSGVSFYDRGFTAVVFGD